MRFEKDRQARIDVKFHKELSPFDHKQPFSVACWFKVTGGDGTYRVMAQTGRWTLGVTKQMEVTFGIFNKEWRVELSVSGGSIEYDVWYHLVGTFDGVMCRVYVQGTEKGSMELVRKAQASTEEEAKARKRDAEALEAQEVLEKEKVAEETIKKTQKWLPSKQGTALVEDEILIEKVCSS